MRGRLCLKDTGGEKSDSTDEESFDKKEVPAGETTGAFLMRIFYAVMVQSHIYQNDLGVLSPDNTGHLGYIYVLYSTGHLPGKNPMTHHQYYQAPLFHMISAVLTRLFAALGYVLDEIPELLQMISVLYGTLTLFFVNKIGKKIDIPVRSRAVVMGIAAFCPGGSFRERH